MPKSSQQIRELVDSLHPRSPKEVMGEAASSSLIGSTITAAMSTVGILLGVTVIVFLFGGGPEKKIEAAAADLAAIASAAEAGESEAGKPVVPTTATETAGGDTGNTNTATTGAENAVEAMGIGETKDADSEPQTLENRLDQLLDGLE